MKQPIISLLVTASMMVLTSFDATISIDHNANNAANREFKFKNISSPLKDDAATKYGADLIAVNDGVLPSDQDEPAKNFFFNAGTTGGRFRFDFGRVIDVAQVNSYSWHPSARAPQVYNLYGSDGLDPKFNPDPSRKINPVTVGWTLIASVNTTTQSGSEGGQYGVSISNPNGGLGKYRHLMFDCFVTETGDDWGNTFYSEIDVIEKK
jgi:hypothetical protein